MRSQTLTIVCTVICVFVACPSVIPKLSLTNQKPAWLTQLRPIDPEPMAMTTRETEAPE